MSEIIKTRETMMLMALGEISKERDELRAENQKLRQAAKHLIEMSDRFGIIEYRGKKPPDIKSLNDMISVFKEALATRREKVNDNF